MKRGPAPGSKEAQRGGQAVKAKYGIDHYSRIGKLGGDKVKKLYGPEYYENIGRKGGEATLRNNGIEYFESIGKIGGRGKKKNILTCSQCNQKKSDVIIVTDPYEEELHGTITERELCDQCYGELLNEI